MTRKLAETPIYILIAGVLCVVPVLARADQIAIPNAFQAGTPARAADVNANFDTLVTESNDQDDRLATVESEATNTTTELGALNTRVTALETAAITITTEIGSPVAIAPAAAGTLDISCSQGIAISGGFDSATNYFRVRDLYPDPGAPDTWRITLFNTFTETRNATPYVVCLSQ
jgi:hypothetical protein